jgi:hypothetical protein
MDPVNQDRQAAKGRMNIIPTKVFDLHCIFILLIFFTTSRSLLIVQPRALFALKYFFSSRLRKGIMLNHKNVCIETKCVLCGEEIAEDQCYQSDNTMNLCLDCRHRSDSLPDIFATSIERFLIGNVL